MSKIDINETLTRLEALLESRKKASASTSYVAKLYQKGQDKIAQKVGEEAVETAMAVAKGDKKELVKESADLLFHLLVLLRAFDLPFERVVEELQRREGLSGLDEKAARDKTDGDGKAGDDGNDDKTPDKAADKTDSDAGN